MELSAGLLPGIVQRPAELGRIRLGEKTDRGTPKMLATFRLTSGSQSRLAAAAVLYGGKVRPWAGAPDEGMWELTTTVAELDILIPGELGAVSQRYEFWQGGTLERGCDGATESVTNVPCLCAAAGLSGADRVCDIVTRVKVMLPRVPGLGVWRLDTSGWRAATTLPATLALLAQMTPSAWIPAVLRAEQSSKKERMPNGKVETHRFVVPVLDSPGTIGQLVPGSGLVAPAEIEAGERPAPPTARERVAAERARIESASNGASPLAATVRDVTPHQAAAELTLSATEAAPLVTSDAASQAEPVRNPSPAGSAASRPRSVTPLASSHPDAEPPEDGQPPLFEGLA